MTADLRREEIARTCEHPSVEAFASRDGGVRLWACHECRLRFYPACETCIDVGHRDEHPVRSQDTATARIADDLYAADVAASLVHDYIWQKPVLSGTEPPAQQQASDAIWTIHRVLRPLIEARAVLSGETRTDGERDMESEVRT